jgi:hypothetical protein
VQVVEFLSWDCGVLVLRTSKFEIRTLETRKAMRHTGTVLPFALAATS